MTGYNLDEAKKLFFDRKPVIDATTKAERRVLSKFGAFVRQRARTSIKRRTKPSLPGEPPSSRTGLLRRFLYFGYEAQQASVIIGPILLSKDRSPEGKPIPQLLEKGGRNTLSKRFAQRRRRKQYTLRARPYMKPALDKELPGLPEMWKDSIKP